MNGIVLNNNGMRRSIPIRLLINISDIAEWQRCVKLCLCVLHIFPNVILAHSLSLSVSVSLLRIYCFAFHPINIEEERQRMNGSNVFASQSSLLSVYRSLFYVLHVSHSRLVCVLKENASSTSSSLLTLVSSLSIRDFN